MPQAPEPSEARRRFLKAIGLAGLSSALAPAAAIAQSPSGPAIYPPGVPPPKGAPSTTAPGAGAKPEPPSEDARALAAIVKRRYGKQLDHQQIESITKDFDGDLQAAKRLHDVKLANGDEPDFTFHP
jgi:hypothetical protein